MELIKYSTLIAFLLFLLASTHSVRGRSVPEMVDSGSEVYAIDYRGPETHSSIPPPGHFHGNRKTPVPNMINKEMRDMGMPKAKSFRGGSYDLGRKGKKIHG